jgi:hypothetical protein
MEHNSISWRKAVPVIRLAALVGFGGASGLWLALAQEGVQALSAAAVLAVTMIFGTVWLSRDRAARRLHAAMEAYAERELGRARLGRFRRAAT